METYHIHINGIVQGVGFRPMVYKLAMAFRLNGYVKNGSNGVHIYFNTNEATANSFFQSIKDKAPRQSKIIAAALYKSEKKAFDNFFIHVEDDNTTKQVLLSPDRAICTACSNELNDKNNRRYRYPFITCTQCGPRYSIINGLPYDRVKTSMQLFEMCKPCKAEYDAVTDRRFFSQTNSCADCGIQLSLFKNRSTLITNKADEVLRHANKILKEGKIIAVKGVGGYLLLCDANNPEAIQVLRTRKHRPAKPFALLYPDIDKVKTDFELNAREEALLQHEAAPIVLLYPAAGASGNLSIENIAPGLNRLGVMLPCSPLLQLLVKDFEQPLIATSANISGSPIIYKDEEAYEFLFEIADYIISYNRAVIIPQDDSVVQVAKHSNQKFIIRRSRGFAPSFIHYKAQQSNCTLSTGAYLKSSFTLLANGNVFISQFMGSGESFESQQMYKHTLAHWMKMYEVEPDVIITDKHPQYFSHQFAKELAERYAVKIKYVQHHEAHFAAVLAENTLMESASPVLGVVWDGTGFGNDGNIWGGEFFIYDKKIMHRCCHFEYFPAIAGDKLALEPRIAALCILSAGNKPVPESIKEKFTAIELSNYFSLISTTQLFSSSAGRIFDAVASLLHICDKQTYEGEAAMYLQALAEEYVAIHGFDMQESYFAAALTSSIIPVAGFLQQIINDIEEGKSKIFITAKFHFSLVDLIGKVAEFVQVKNICFSGGVFQNTLLVDWMQHIYKERYQLHFHINLSANDENISFGQMVYHDYGIKTASEKPGLNKDETTENADF